MLKTDNSPTPDTQIRMERLSIDKMRLTVTKIRAGSPTGNFYKTLSDF